MGVAGGNINVEVMDLQVVNGGTISSSTFGDGDGGSIAITAESILVDGQSSQFVTGIFAQTQLAQGGGSGGDINIEVIDLQVINGGTISADTFGSGDGGTVTVTAESILVDRQNSQFFTGISAQTQLIDFGGDGGSIIVETKNLRVVDGGQISAATLGRGDGGNIVIHVNELFIGSGAAISAEAGDLSLGQAGNIRIVADGFIELVNGAINTSAPKSSGGDIQIKAESNINLSKESQISSNAAINGGDITIKSNKLIQLIDSDITAVAGDNGGSIAIKNQVTILKNSRLSAGTLREGGNVFINTNGFFANVNGRFVKPEEVIEVTGSLGVSAPNIDLTAGLVPLSEDFLDIDSWAVADCATRYERGEISTFHVIYREGIVLAPDDVFAEFFDVFRVRE